jgi:hypothetical protein
MGKRGRPPNDDVEDDVRAAIVHLTVESISGNVDGRVKAAGEEFRRQAKRPGWRDLLKIDSPRTIYSLLKRFRSNTKK